MPSRQELQKQVEKNEPAKHPEVKLLAGIKRQTLQDLISKEQKQLHYLLMIINKKINFEMAIQSPKIFQLQRSWEIVYLSLSP